MAPRTVAPTGGIVVNPNVTSAGAVANWGGGF
jgi:hypothetical protein